MKLALILLLCFCSLALPADEQNYQKAISLIDSRNYQEALARLRAELDGRTSRADAALYWSAYAQAKLGNADQALKSIEMLKAQYAASKWVNDARSLALEIQQSTGTAVSPEAQSDEELKLIAIQGLMNAEPERAVPLLEGILNSNKSPKLKQQAMFVLSQNSSPKAKEILTRLAKNNADPALQKSAIHNLGIGGKRNGPFLEEVYKSNPSAEVKEQILHAFMISGDRERLGNLAKNEPDEKLRLSAIHWLGVSGGKDALPALYTAPGANTKVKQQVLQALFISGGAKEIVSLARAEKDPALKREAVRKLSLMNSPEATEFLTDILK